MDREKKHGVLSLLGRLALVHLLGEKRTRNKMNGAPLFHDEAFNRKVTIGFP
jgi:hypothetical protein